MNNQLDLPSHTERFFENTLQIAEFIYSLLVRLNKDTKQAVSPEIIQLGTVVLKSYNRREIIEGYIRHSWRCWDKIFDKEEQYITDNAFSIFSSLPSQHVSAFKEVFSLRDANGNQLVDINDRETLWRFFFSFVKIAIKFIHDEREPYSHNGQCRYAKRYFQEIDLQIQAKKWNIKLGFPEK